MRTRLVSLALCGLAVALPLTSPACGPASSGGAAAWASHTGDVPFVIGYAEGLAAAARGDKPLLFLFTADW